MCTTYIRAIKQRYEQRQEERLYERQKAAAAAAASLEAAKETEENKRMILEELRSWDACELNTRNHNRMIEQVLLVGTLHRTLRTPHYRVSESRVSVPTRQGISGITLLLTVVALLSCLNYIYLRPGEGN